jgi:hypothetical protein
VADDALVAVLGLQIGMLAEKVRDLGLDRPGEQGTRPDQRWDRTREASRAREPETEEWPTFRYRCDQANCAQ